ncbi:MAG: sodium-dependent transporter [Bacteroidales bacterium]|nr:sodium-dependent transporter [Bacteroidales bacterium]
MSRDGFGSKVGIIAAAAGSAVGLGNIYRFPCELGNNGGGAFLLVYLLIVLCLGIPVMLSELVIGRRTQKNPIGAFKMLKPRTAWPAIGYMGVFCAFIIMAFYSTVAGWTLEYIVKAVGNQFQGKELAVIEQEFADFHNIGWKNVLWQGVFIFLTGFVVFKGVADGIEKYAKILMPLLVVILIALAIRSVTLPGAGEGLSFLFHPDFSKITGSVLISALGQAFFSLSMGMGVLITYGSYIKKDDNLTTTALSVTLSDTLVAVLAGIVIFPAAFSFGVKPTAGMGLVFSTLPMIFNQMAGGYFFCIIFFVLLAVAALTSTISLLEVIVAYFVEELHMKRRLATVVAAVGCMAVGVFASLSLKSGSGLTIGGMTFFDSLDFLSAKILLPVGAFFIVIFVGWIMGKTHFYEEITNDGRLKITVKGVIYFIIKYLAPLAIAVIFISGFLQ